MYEAKYPWARLLFMFDWSSNHSAKGEGIPNVNEMNLNEGGAQSIFYPQTVNGITYVYNNAEGAPKGMKLICEERGLLGKDVAKKLRKEDFAALLAKEPDFKYFANRTALHDVIEAVREKGHICDFIPKFHPELSPAEPCWAASKRTTREYCRGTIDSLRAVLPLSFDALCGEQVRKFFAKCLRAEELYRHVISEEDSVKFMLYHSHRMPANAKRPLLALQEKWKLELQSRCFCSSCLKVACSCHADYCDVHHDQKHTKLAEQWAKGVAASKAAVKAGGSEKRSRTNAAKALKAQQLQHQSMAENLGIQLV